MTNLNAIRSLFEKQLYAECLSAIRASDKSDELERLKGYCLQRLGNHQEAIDVWNGLIARHPDAAEFYAERGVCKLHLGLKSTLDDFHQAVELEPDNPYRYACRAYTLDKAGNTRAAIHDYQKALELEPDNEVTLNNLGLLEEKLGYADMAKDRFKQADLLANMQSELTIEETQKDVSEIPQPASSVRKELKTMMSSRKEFMRFLREAGTLLRKGKI
ncbi:MAG: tetratricopeptide repeat protein [Bacteroidetes bacterium]|nr:tetratricopeptide repeat protein [Bacteroidota bacterium]